MKKDNEKTLHPINFVIAFLIGAMLFWVIGRGWLDLSSIPIFITGLIGVAVAVLTFAVWNIYYSSHHKEN